MLAAAELPGLVRELSGLLDAKATDPATALAIAGKAIAIQQFVESSAPVPADVFAGLSEEGRRCTLSALALLALIGAAS